MQKKTFSFFSIPPYFLAIFFILSLFIIPLSSYAISLGLTPHHPSRYVVQQGDTLWSIASKFLQKPWEWRKLWHANRDVKNPNLIYPGDVLELYQHNGQYGLKRVSRGVVKLYPVPKASPLEEAIPTIPYSDIKPFLKGVQVVSIPKLESAAHVLALQHEYVVAGNGVHIFVSDEHWPSRKYFSIFRTGEPLQDPVTHEVLGLAAMNVGEARLIQRGDPSTMMVTKSYREVQRADRVLPMPPRMSVDDFFPQPPHHHVEGHIISFLTDAAVVAQHDVVIIDRGRVNGIRRGDVLAIFHPGPFVSDLVPSRLNPHGLLCNHHPDLVKLPDERIGEMIIFRLFDRVSYGLILQSTQSIQNLDLVENP